MAITDAHPDLKRTLKFFPVENENPATLYKAQIQHFNENGFISPLDALTCNLQTANKTIDLH